MKRVDAPYLRVDFLPFYLQIIFWVVSNIVSLIIYQSQIVLLTIYCILNILVLHCSVLYLCTGKP